MLETIRFFANTSLNNLPSSGQNEERGEVCIANISLPERQKRMRFAIIQFAFTLLALSAMIVFQVAPVWRLLLLLMFWAASVGYFEAHDKTCVAWALKDSRKMGEKAEKIEDRAELKQVHRQSRGIMLKAFLAALAFTVIAYLLP